jgi:FKBP-type peptidyl-prolyl cis-trans isomerase
MMDFHYTRYMPYVQAKRQREMFNTDRPDTLPTPNVPELFDETYTKEGVTAMLGRGNGASLINIKEDIDIKWVVNAIHDCLALESEEAFVDGLKLTEEQLTKAFMEFQVKRQQREREEYERKLVENKEASEKWLAEVEQMENVVKTESGLLYRIDREGSDVYATADTDVVEVNYEGKTRDGKVFDSSYERGESISFGLNQVIRGWTEGMKLVGEGGQITLWIPSDMAYGTRGAGANIGPNEALEFKVELIKVNPEEK